LNSWPNKCKKEGVVGLKLKQERWNMTVEQLIRELSLLEADEEIKSINLDGRIDPARIEVEVAKDGSSLVIY
jgi:hypothetical protein